MSNICERRKPMTAAEFRVKATSFRTVAANPKDAPLAEDILAWDARAETDKAL
jgi:hypothetical protein